MARKAIVTRTIMGTKVTVLGLNTETEAPEKKEVIISGKADEAKALKEVQKFFKDSSFTVAKVLGIEPYNKLLGMYEEDFIAHAMELDPETRKPLNA